MAILFSCPQNRESFKVAPVDKLSVVFSIILAMIILGEKLNFMTGIGVVFITAGVLFIAFS